MAAPLQVTAKLTLPSSDVETVGEKQQAFPTIAQSPPALKNGGLRGWSIVLADWIIQVLNISFEIWAPWLIDLWSSLLWLVCDTPFRSQCH